MDGLVDILHFLFVHGEQEKRFMKFQYYSETQPEDCDVTGTADM
jgi:hypothetical protein